MKKSSKQPSKNRNKGTVKKEDLKNISGGRQRFPDLTLDPDDIIRFFEEHKKNRKE